MKVKAYIWRKEGLDMDPLKWIFQNSKIFPPQPKQDQFMGQQSEKAEGTLKQLKMTFTKEQSELFWDYLAQQEQLTDMELHLAYENGFLFAAELWLEIFKRL